MKKYAFVFLFVVVATLMVATIGSAAPQGAAPEVTTKQVAVAPADMAEMRLPSPADTGVRSRTTMIPIVFENGRFSTNIAIDSANTAIMIMAPDSDSWTVQFDSADINSIASREEATVDGDGQSYTGDLYRLEKMEAGQYALTINANQRAERSDLGDAAVGYIIVSSESDYRLYAHLTTHDLLVGNKVGLTAYVYNVNQDGLSSAPTAVANIIEKAVMHITTPAGKTESVAMEATADGTFTAEIEAMEAGEYTAQIEVSGMDGKRPFVRTSEHIFPIIQSDVTLLARLPKTAVTADDDLSIQLEAKLGAEQSGELLISAEVWGRNGKEMTPVSWVSNIVTIEQGKESVTLPLTVDGRWFGMAGVSNGIELRNIRVQDMDTFIPLSYMDSLPVRAARLPQAAKSTVTAVTDDMLMGTPPETAVRGANYVGGHKLMLVHGYCSSPVWSSSQFTGDVLFQDYEQNRTHNEFATRIRDFGSQYDSFGVVAHSQGGPATVHLYTYYWSGLDYSSGSRLIQSVGSPYQGTALAGNLAALGAIFGAGCGTNWDLTYDGAALWLANIPSWARGRTYYYTTSFTDHWWSYDYCHIATDLFLDDPDDGTTEKWAGQLSGAHNMGHKTGWCHTLSMSEPGQTTDGSRNSTMNAYANR